MGCYDSFAKNIDDSKKQNTVQLKVGECLCRLFLVGDKVYDINDGLYIGYEGVVLIQNSTVAAVILEEEIKDKWGNNINLKELMDKNSPIVIAMSKIKQEILDKRD